jgi:NAD(P)H-hydrate repair Nnr-like enzyme with NAD(P)H-hydrate dehydratase domain
MSYKDFTLETVRKRFGLTIESNQDLFSGAIQSVTLADAFTGYLSYSVPLALAINTEKARSEMIIAPMLVELKRLLNDQVSLFSGVEFNVDSEQELTGFCDFIISLSRQQLYISAPAFIVFEAKNENIKGGLGQCLAAMIAARLFNEREGQTIGNIYGAVTTGNQWKFLNLKGDIAYIDFKDYYIDRVDDIMGILVSLVQAPRELVLA